MLEKNADAMQPSLEDHFRGVSLGRLRNLFDPACEQPFRLSRTKLELFSVCERCFYLDRRLGVEQPGGLPYTINSAIDVLLKREFDAYRELGQPHPLMLEHKIAAVPFSHPELEKWRDGFKRGISFLVPGTTLEFFGGVDDVWQNESGALHIVDYKATAKQGKVSMQDTGKDRYKRQIEMYQWIFRQNGFDVSALAYFVYCNADKSVESFAGLLKFKMEIFPHQGDDSWVPKSLQRAYECLMADEIPAPNLDCKHCKYRAAAHAVEE